MERLGRLDELPDALRDLAREADWDALDEGVPLALLPVRLETRFVVHAGPPPWVELRVRVHPDQLHVDAHEPLLDDREQRLGRRFWRWQWRAADDRPRQLSAWTRLVELLGPWRAAFVADSTRPLNPHDRPSGPPLSKAQALDPKPRFPSLSLRTQDRRPRAALLPDRWAVVGYHRGDPIFTAWGGDIADALALSPDPGAAAEETLDDPEHGQHAVWDPRRDPDLAWQVDWQAAVEAGMGVSVRLTGDVLAYGRDGISLFVLGLRKRPRQKDAEGQALRDLLRAHHYSEGAAFLPAGTPTNNTEATKTPYHAGRPDLEALYDREVLDLQANPPSAHDAARLGRALGVPGNQLLHRLTGGSADGDRRAAAMNELLWPVTLGITLDELMAPEGGEGPLTGAERLIGRRWFIDDLRAAGPLPCLRVGDQPYGVLPTAVLHHHEIPEEKNAEDQLSSALVSLWDFWLESVPSAPRLDPDAIDALNAKSPPEAATDAEQTLTRLLASQPDPAQLSVTTLRERRHEGLEHVQRVQMQGLPVPLSITHDLGGFVDVWEDTFNLLRALPYDPFHGGAAERQMREALNLYDQQAALDTMVEDIAQQSAHERGLILRYLLAAQTSDAALGRLSLAQGQTWHDSDGAVVPWRLRAIDWAALADAAIRDLGSVTISNPQDAIQLTADIQAIRDAQAEAERLSADLLDALDIVEQSQARLDGLTKVATPLVAEPLQALLDAHRARLAPARAIQALRNRGLEDRFPEAGPSLVYSLYDKARRPWVAPLVRPGRGQAARYLQKWADHLERGAPAPSPASPQPLLHQLIASAAPRLVEALKPSFIDALRALAEADDAELELRLRQTLGAVSHRLDAWVTLLAKRRLDQLRASQGRGLQIGAFGMVEGLKPAEGWTWGARKVPSRGFIHAPSIPHAITASVLRSGWLALGSGKADSAAAVDLRSSRVRQARRALEGVRAGQTLGEILGYRFERGLHEARLDRFIDPVRRVLLDGADPKGPVDGLALARLWGGRGLSAADTTRQAALNDLVQADDAVPSDTPLRAVLDALDAELDAISDLTLAESVHQLVQGNSDRAAATLEAISSGELPPPPMTVLDTPRPGIDLDHRLLVLLQDEALGRSRWPSAGHGRALMEPQLDAWLAGLLGDPNQAGCEVAWIDDEGQLVGVTEIRAADLGVCASDLVYLAPRGEGFAGTELEARARQAALASPPQGCPPNPQLRLRLDASSLSMSFTELFALCRALRRLVCEARPADARDLTPGNAAAARRVDSDELRRRLMSLVVARRDALAKLEARTPERARQLEDPAGLRAALDALARLGVHGATPRAGFAQGPDTLEDRRALLRQARRVRDSVDAQVKAAHRWSREGGGAEGFSRLDEATQLQQLAEQTAALLGRAFRALPRFSMPAPLAQELDASFAHGPERVGPVEVEGWLRQVCKVRAGAERLATASDFADALADKHTVPLRPIQLPHTPKEPWVGTRHPGLAAARSGGRLNLVVAASARLSFFRDADVQPLCGLVVDRWSERIPGPTATTGLSFQFDAPGSQAPQLILLAVAARHRRWSFSEALDTLRQTMTLARIRAVGPESLQGPGHFLPAIFTPEDLDPGEEA